MNLQRWWTYQAERFPVFGHGLLIATFSSSAFCYSYLLRWQENPSLAPPPWWGVAVGFVCCFLFFLQLRIADEFKDAEEDARWRPERAVPRGLVTLRELGWVFVFAGLIQVSAVLFYQLSLICLLLVVWIYLALMSQEFFIRDWLKAHPVHYLWSHMLIMPLIDLFATACDWWPTTIAPPHGIHWFLFVSFFNGMVIEVGRKMAAPADEREGVETYTFLWGAHRAGWIWWTLLLCTAIIAWLAAREIGFELYLGPVLVAGVFLGFWAALRFSQQPTRSGAKRFEHLAGFWTLLMYGGLGLVPFFWLR